MILGAEWRKLVSTRLPWVLLAVAQLVIVAGVSGLMLNRPDATAVTGQREAVAHIGLVSLFTLVLGCTAVAGEYRLRFGTGDYFKGVGAPVFYPEVTVRVRLAGPGGKYHLPLLLSPLGYSTYRGS